MWSFAMIILNSKEDAYDAEMLLYTMTLINKVCSSDLDSDSHLFPPCALLSFWCHSRIKLILLTSINNSRSLQTLYSLPDQDTFYDMVDQLELQGMQSIVRYYNSPNAFNTTSEFLQQLQIYEVRACLHPNE